MVEVDKEEIEIKPIENLDEKTLKTLLRFDKNNQKINFPKDSPNEEATIERIKKEYEEEPEGMNLVTYKDKIIGCLFLKTEHNPYRRCRYGDLRAIYLVEEFRYEGIGEILMSHMEYYFKEKGCEYMFLGTSVDNEKAKRLFKKMGFTETRVLMERKLQ